MADRGPWAIVELSVGDRADQFYNDEGELLTVSLPVYGVFDDEELAEDNVEENQTVIEVFP